MHFNRFLKSALAVVFVCFVSVSAFAQGFYVKLGGGYNAGLRANNYFQSFANGHYLGSGYPNGFMQFKEVKINPGTGTSSGVAAGYMFNKRIGVEVGVNYLAGSESKAKYEDQPNNPDFDSMDFPLNGIPAPANTEIFTTKSRMVLVQPAIILAAGLPKFNPYLRAGLILAKGNLKNSYSFSSSSYEPVNAEDTYSGNLGFGFQGALGVSYRMTNKFEILAEGAFNKLTYAPEKGELQSFTRNGTDLMPSLNTANKEIHFEEKPVENTDNQQAATSPSSGPEQKFSLNSIGLALGVKYNF